MSMMLGHPLVESDNLFSVLEEEEAGGFNPGDIEMELSKWQVATLGWGEERRLLILLLLLGKTMTVPHRSYYSSKSNNSRILFFWILHIDSPGVKQGHKNVLFFSPSPLCTGTGRQLWADVCEGK